MSATLKDAASGAALYSEATIPESAVTSVLGADPDIKNTIKILIIEDEHTLRESCASVLQHEGYDVTSCGRGETAREMVQRRSFDIVLTDLYMSEVSGMELLRTCLQTRPETLVIVMTGNPSVTSNLEALRAGAWDYLPKPFTATHLQILVGRACHAILVARESDSAPPEPDKQDAHTSAGSLLGKSPAFVRAIRLAQKVARTDASVFITGESGTGKEMFAQFIHQNSRRSSRPMVAVNCAALPETLLESEMFGHVKGAFTGAIRDKLGLLETANGGTLFLDELTEMSHPVQAKLLRVIQDGVVRRVGSETVDAVVNVRFIAATNRDPKEATDQGTLRSDLFYRLSVVPIHLPPLRERPEDIPLLAQHFLTFYWKRHRERHEEVPTFSRAAIESLQSREWKGNVRELQNVIEHAVVLLDPGIEIQPEDLPAAEGSGAMNRSQGWIADVVGQEESYHEGRERVIAQFELKYLGWLMDQAGANMSKAAKLAGVDRTTLYRLMEKHGLHRNTTISQLTSE
jgi:DNA-binding NtrC family response regulator